MISACSHLQGILDPATRKAIIQRAVLDLYPLKNKFQAIAFCGNSGALIVPSVADLLDKAIILVRKRGVDCASQELVEGEQADKYIIIDDLVCSGTTVKHILKSIRDYHHLPARCLGIYLYADVNKYDITHPENFKLRFKIEILNAKSIRDSLS